MSPFHYVSTQAFVTSLEELLSQEFTEEVITILWYTLPRDWRGASRVMNLRAQWKEHHRLELDGLVQNSTTPARIRLALGSVLDDLLHLYPDWIEVQDHHALQHLGPNFIHSQLESPSEPWEEEIEYADVQSHRSNPTAGLAIIAILIIAITGTWFLLWGRGASPDSNPELGWVLLLKEGKDCPSLQQRYDYVFRHHPDVETIPTATGTCRLLIRFPNRQAAEQRRERSTTLGPAFPDMRILEL